MGKRGPKPKPMAIRALEGTTYWGQHKGNTELATVPFLEHRMPIPLRGDKQAENAFKMIMSSMPPNFYKQVDHNVLVRYCLSWSTYLRLIEIEREILGVNAPIHEDWDKNPHGIKAGFNPARITAALARQHVVLNQLSGFLGLDPHSRAELGHKMQTVSDNKPKSKFDGLLGSQPVEDVPV